MRVCVSVWVSRDDEKVESRVASDDEEEASSCITLAILTVGMARASSTRSAWESSAPGLFHVAMPARLSTPKTTPSRAPAFMSGECSAKDAMTAVVGTVFR